MLADYSPAKRVALLAALVFSAQAKARDDIAEMFRRRVATLTKRSRTELEELKERHRAITERLVDNDKSVLERIDPDGMDAAQEQAALEMTPRPTKTVGDQLFERPVIFRSCQVRILRARTTPPEDCGGPDARATTGGDDGCGEQR